MVLNRHPEATERLLENAERFKSGKSEGAGASALATEKVAAAGGRTEAIPDGSGAVPDGKADASNQ